MDSLSYAIKVQHIKLLKLGGKPPQLQGAVFLMPLLPVTDICQSEPLSVLT